MLPSSASDHVHDHSHDHSNANRASHHDEGAPPGHTCCQLTGKYAFTVASPPPSPSPPAVLVTIPTSTDTPDRLLAIRLRRFRPEPTQHAPPYLCFLSLLI
jgi:hypothetical protein